MVQYFEGTHLQAQWCERLSARLNELARLPVGWDGYRATAISEQTARFVADLLVRLFDEKLPTPSLVPGSDDSLQIEWHFNQYDIELNVISVNNVVAMRHDRKTGQIEELSIDADLSPLFAWIKDLCGRIAT